MLVHVEKVLTPGELAEFRAALEPAPWADGRATAGQQSALAKRNLQAPADAPEVRALSERLLGLLGRNETFVSAALPLRVFPPLFNRYDVGMDFGAHVDNAIRFSGSVRFRTDVSATLFLTPPEDYDGGELVVQDVYGEQRVKLPAGHMVLYPATSVHRVDPVTRGSRWAAFFWAQSMVKDEGARTLLYGLDRRVQSLAAKLGHQDEDVIALTGAYHNLLRRWSEV